MDAITLIKQDHDTVDALFKKLESGGFEQPDVIAEIIRELKIHAEIEERLLYPAVERQAEEGGEQVEEGEQEHTEIKALISRIEAAGPDKVEREVACTELIAVVRHHVEEEEGEMLPDFRKASNPDQLEQLGIALLKAKLELGGAEGLTKDSLLALAEAKGIEGRSSMTKDELSQALSV